MLVFWKNGYDATTVRLLEKEMGINQFSIYSSFVDKKNLFIRSLHKYREHLSQTSFRNLLKEDANLGDLKSFLLNFSKSSPNNSDPKGCLVVNTAGELGASDTDILRELNAYFVFIKQMFKKILDRSKRTGEISDKTDTEKLSNYLLVVVQGLSINSRMQNKKQTEDIIKVALTNIQ